MKTTISSDLTGYTLKNPWNGQRLAFRSILQGRLCAMGGPGRFSNVGAPPNRQKYFYGFNGTVSGGIMELISIGGLVCLIYAAYCTIIDGWR